MKYIPKLDDPAGKALVIIDMQIEDSPQGFWQAYNWETTVANSQQALNACRKKAYPVVHLMVARRPNGVDCHRVRTDSTKYEFSVQIKSIHYIQGL